MVEYITDLAIVSLLIIVITAFLGVIPNAIGIKIFGRKMKDEYPGQTAKTQTGWKRIGGNIKVK